MIELRWLAKNVYGDGKVLQARYWSGSRIVQKGDGAGITYEQGEWSEWADVPTVTEPLP